MQICFTLTRLKNKNFSFTFYTFALFVEGMEQKKAEFKAVVAKWEGIVDSFTREERVILVGDHDPEEADDYQRMVNESSNLSILQNGIDFYTRLLDELPSAIELLRAKAKRQADGFKRLPESSRKWKKQLLQNKVFYFLATYLITSPNSPLSMRLCVWRVFQVSIKCVIHTAPCAFM